MEHVNTSFSVLQYYAFYYSKKKDRCIKAGLTFLRNPSYNVSYSTLTC